VQMSKNICCLHKPFLEIAVRDTFSNLLTEKSCAVQLSESPPEGLS
jgi:hypothetical protein